jgi:uncharacterized protein (TIGR03435 family)
MLQRLLADRFGLVLRRETREMPVYVLSAAKGGPRLTPWKEGDVNNLGVISSSGRHPEGKGSEQGAEVRGRKASMAWLSDQLARVTQRPVLDRTGITGDFNYDLIFEPLPTFGDAVLRWDGIPMTTRSLFTVLEQDLGLRLEPSRGPVEVLVIERVERPSEN